MKRTAIILIVTSVAVALLSCKTTQTQKASSLTITTASPSPLKTSGYVTDDANVIDEPSRKQLETTLAALKSRKRIDFSVVALKTTGDQSVRDYSLILARQRKTNGQEENISGLLLLVAVDDRKWHIQITRNLEDDLTNEILTNLSVPMTESFRQKRYGEGIIKYVDALIAKLDQIDSTAAVNRN